ncbi:hypothetical protein AWB71_03280 [Caballeronia peredens]|nr:hypothetical protein AWB71_03280 [Caballeronia peredens]
MFSRDIKDFQCRAPRSLNEAFGPYSKAKLHVPKRKSRVAALLWMGFYAGCIAGFWYAILLVRSA